MEKDSYKIVYGYSSFNIGSAELITHIFIEKKERPEKDKNGIIKNINNNHIFNHVFKESCIMDEIFDIDSRYFDDMYYMYDNSVVLGRGFDEILSEEMKKDEYIDGYEKMVRLNIKSLSVDIDGETCRAIVSVFRFAFDDEK